MTDCLMEGNEAVAWGAMAAGCRFFAGYPITPATSIFNTMLKLLPPAGGIVLQGEDEIASIGYCLGASMAGLKAMTATSGPGISLYSEHISFAVGSEIPIVIVDVQRLGPSTGSATRGADGDVQFLRWGSSGGLPVIVLAPVDAQDCFSLTVRAFNLAEQYRCPVFLASNKEVGLTRETIAPAALAAPPVVDRRAPATSEGFLPFRPPPDRPIPDFLPIGGDTLVRQTSSTHGSDGYITTDAAEIGRMRIRLKEKLLREVSHFSYHDLYPDPEADTLLITYGVTARAARACVNLRHRHKKRVALLVLKTLWPVPADLIRSQAAPFRRIVVPEMNLGQYGREIERILPGKTVDGFGQMDGRLITPEQIEEVFIHG